MPTRIPLSPAPEARRQREYRRRQREGVRIVRHKLWPYRIAALIKGGWLSKAEARDDAALEAAVDDLFDCWARGTLDPDPTQQGPR